MTKIKKKFYAVFKGKLNKLFGGAVITKDGVRSLVEIEKNRNVKSLVTSSANECKDDGNDGDGDDGDEDDEDEEEDDDDDDEEKDDEKVYGGSYSDEEDDYDEGGYCGFSRSDCDELISQGVKPWESDAENVMFHLNGGGEDY